ncbi:MAG: M28 family peptidase [bacterium]
MTAPSLELRRSLPRNGRLAALIVLTTLLAGCGQRIEGESAVSPGPLDRVMAAAAADTYTYALLSELCDTVGERLAGSEGMKRAVAWSRAAMIEAGCDSVWTEPVTVPHWTRGREWARCLGPVAFDLEMCGLGLSVGTGPEGIEGEVLAVRDFEELEARADEAAGRIVLFDPPWEGYGKTVQYRVNGASRAAAHGAVACLIRSVTDHSLGAPHTGVMRYADDVPRIPAAALTVEDAARLSSMCRRGLRPRVKLFMEAELHGETTCYNVIGDIRGTELPEEIVLVSGHLDSWDLGPNAHDDGAGCALALGSAALLLKHDMRPRRTIRIVHFTSEEFGGHGGRAYLEAHRHELDHHVLAIESDSGAFAPRGFSVQADSTVVAAIADLTAPLARLAPDRWQVEPGGSGVDIGPIVRAGVPGVGHRVEHELYFSYHHSRADSFDKIDRGDLALNVAAIAGLVLAVADDPVTLRPHAAPGGE